ncbi:hypothetical protein KZX45_08330 [Georgenia sp. EYE_87]|uniref:hypothetical protein n=1 Tax=Georgenia sp. EYE_87 TaxID=2853448 RepID=UPI002005D855|nr:hypothetical protein [Georgenia sp. EYE_87]MCK6210548.1 hypothetical protein [Georgenia sp. EYE_87]
MNRISKRPQSEQMAVARRLLKRRADHGGALMVAEGIDAGIAFWAIEALHPPFPPTGSVGHLPVPDIEEVRSALMAAASAAISIEEAAAIAHAARELAGDRLGVDGAGTP